MKEISLLKIRKTVIDILNNYFKFWHPSSKTIDIMANGAFQYVMENPDFIEDPFEFRREIKNYIKNSILYTCSHNPQSNLMEIFFTPYQNVYIESNQFLNLEDSKINKLLFVQAVLDTILEGTNIHSKYAVKTRISTYYQLNRKSYEARTGIKRKKNTQKYYESKYNGDLNLFQELLSYLDSKEQEDILNATFMSERFTNAFRKINNGIKVYFLLTYLNYQKEEKIHLIKEAMDSSKNYAILKKLQEEYANKFNITISQLLDELNKRTKNIETRYLSVFLGIDFYNLEDEVCNKEISTIIQKAVMITQKLVKEHSRKGLYSYFLYYPIYDIQYALNDLKEKRPNFYEIIIKRHGITLEENHNITSKESDLYFLGIKIMRKTLANIAIERKEKLKSSLKNSQSMLYLIKERRRNTSIQELSQKYSISKEKIGILFANNLLLFGSLIPEIIQELKDLNIPIESSNHYQFYQEYTLQKKC